MFEAALKARIPFIGVQTDDLVYFRETVQSIAGETIGLELTTAAGFKPMEGQLYSASSLTPATGSLYKALEDKNASCIFVNCEPHPSVVDAGMLPSPTALIQKMLSSHVGAAEAMELIKSFKGLSLKTSMELVRLAAAMYGEITKDSLRKTRAMYSGAVPGLYPVDTTIKFYDCPNALASWVNINKAYFLQTEIPELTPRGMLMTGPGGTGKSLAAKKIANEFGVPLYRLDIATTLDRYVGVSENRVARILNLADREAPCVLLIDEVEKIFKSNEADTGVTSRILSQLLWWLSEHQSKVFTVMTTNDIDAIPKELYRPGRMDRALQFNLLDKKSGSTIVFMVRVFESILDREPSDYEYDMLKLMLATEQIPFLSASAVTQIVKDCIKLHGMQ